MNATSKAELKPTPQEIAARAYQLWENEGRKPGQDMKYWLQAEKELSAASRPAVQTTTSSPQVANAAPGVKTNSKSSRANGRQGV